MLELTRYPFNKANQSQFSVTEVNMSRNTRFINSISGLSTNLQLVFAQLRVASPDFKRTNEHSIYFQIKYTPAYCTKYNKFGNCFHLQ